MTQKGIQELVEAVRLRYRQASCPEKTRILNEFVAITGYHRKHTIRLLQGMKNPKRKHQRGQLPIYNDEVKSTSLRIWEICEQICSSRLQPFLPEMVAVLEREGVLWLSAETKCSLSQMSRTTIDRLLGTERSPKSKSRCTTKPRIWLMEMIPVRTFADGDEIHLGFVEIDLVANGDESPAGEYLHALNAVDVAAGCVGPAQP